MRALLGGQRRPHQLEADARNRGDPSHDDLEAFGRRGAAQRHEVHRITRLALYAREPGEVDPVPDRNDLPRGERERARLDGDHGSREPFCEMQEATLLPVREPQQHRHPPRTRKRRSEHGVDRAHVGDHGERSAAAAELRGQRSFELHPTCRLGGAREEADATVLGERALDRSVGEHDDLVDATGQSADLGDRRPEHGRGRIDLLGHEDEAARVSH